MRFAILLVISSLFFCSCSNDSQKKKEIEDAPFISQQFTDDKGNTIRLSKKPTKVISLAPNITEIVFAIGAGDKLIGRSQACDYPDAALYKDEIITYPSLDLEQIKASGAELLLTTDEIFTPDDISQLERLGIPVYQQSYKSVADIFRGIRKLGEVLDVEERANVVADSLSALEKKISEKTENLVKYNTILLITNNDPLMVAGGRGYLNELIKKAGAKNAFAQTNKPYETITPEAFLASKPEYLILPSSNDQVYADFLTNFPSLYYTVAEKNNQVHIVDPDLIYRPGPRVVQGLMMLTQIFHSQLTPEEFVKDE
ncbi:MAG: helical backbone metal receptor [Bacteroidota bacterium]